MAKRFQCERCGAKGAEPGLCARCGGDLLDPEHPADRRYLEALQAIRPSAAERLWRWLSENTAMAVSAGVAVAMALNLDLIGELAAAHGMPAAAAIFTVSVGCFFVVLLARELIVRRRRHRDVTPTPAEALVPTSTASTPQRMGRPQEQTTPP